MAPKRADGRQQRGRKTAAERARRQQQADARASEGKELPVGKEEQGS